MRFYADGPELPDELLVARDDGQVLFFCGSGVSIANAKLPSFLGLAELVLQALRALPDSAPRQLMDIANALQDRKVPGVSGILAADRLFGLLEREFGPADIAAAVGAALRSAPDVDLTAHRALIDLSRTATRTVQLVTTNFDLLFEKAVPALPTWTPNKLPDLTHGPFHGIIHLHGMLDQSYRKPIGGDLVLSSAEFGRAYLSEGWATKFIRDAIERYTIVFVGYTADDPPVQYLLEALNRDRRENRRPMYAFQPGLQSEAAALWAHKGVTAIPYAVQSHDHSALWRTLNAWAQRAKNPEKWRQSVVKRGRRGPEALTPHERGQMMHLALTPDGVKTIVESKPPIPASWLMTLDPAERYETPGRRIFTAEQAAIDPFPDYCLDTDPMPKPDEDGQLYRQREVPEGAIDALVENNFDRGDKVLASIYGANAATIIPLPPRLRALTAWIAGTAEQPLALWWALNKSNLHPLLLDSIEHRFTYSRDVISESARTAWHYIFASRRPRHRSPLSAVHAVQSRIEREGWSLSVRRALVTALRPVLSATRPTLTRPIKDLQRVRPLELVHVSLNYESESPIPTVPDEELAKVVPMVRRMLEDVSTAEAEISPFALNHIPPINTDPRLAGRTYERDHGFNRLVFWYIGLFERLLRADGAAALREFSAWNVQNNTLFDRLRVWACGIQGFLPPDQAIATLAQLSDDAFWTERGQRDVLLSLKSRWAQLDDNSRESLERRLLHGPPRFAGVSKGSNLQIHAHMILDRVLWLEQQNCPFVLPTAKALEKARRDAPKWRDSYAVHAADSHEGTGGIVKTDPTFDQLKEVPIRELLRRAIDAKERDHSVFVDHDPLSGLVEKKPVRILRALVLETLAPLESRWAWAKFLNAAGRRDDDIRMVRLIACRLLAMDDAKFGRIIGQISGWLAQQAGLLYPNDRQIVEALVDRITNALAASTDDTGAPKKKQKDWLNAAMSTPAGLVICILGADPSLPPLSVGGGLPAPWKTRIESCLSLPGDSALLALYQLTRHLAWLFGRDREWVEAVILSALTDGGEREEAVLASFLNNPEVAERALYEWMKNAVFRLVSGELTRPSVDVRAFTKFLLSGWLTTDPDGRWLSDMDMRTALVRGVQALRLNTLWQVGQWDFPDKYYFLSTVWPLQLAARSGTVSERLCDIAIEDGAHFVELAEAILPLLVPVRKGALMFMGKSDTNTVFVAHPEIALEIYWRILPEESSEWPYGVHQGLEALYQNAKSIRLHPHMLELMRRRRKGYF